MRIKELEHQMTGGLFIYRTEAHLSLIFTEYGTKMGTRQPRQTADILYSVRLQKTVLMGAITKNGEKVSLFSVSGLMNKQTQG